MNDDDFVTIENGPDLIPRSQALMLIASLRSERARRVLAEREYDEAHERWMQFRSALTKFVQDFDFACRESSDGWRISLADLVEADRLAERVLLSPDVAREALTELFGRSETKP